MMPVHISEEALKFIKEKVSKARKNDVVVYFAGFGWGGPKFGIEIADPNKNDELIYEDNDFKLYIDQMAKQFLNEVNIVLKNSLFSGKYLSIKGSRSC